MSRYLVDPQNITNFKSNLFELQLVILFWICAAGKKASTSAKALNDFLSYGSVFFNKIFPFDIVQCFSEKELPFYLKKFGIGCYNNKSNCMKQLIEKKFDLSTCTVSDLESVKGIGPKTARCFLLHTRKGSKYAGLDTHVLKYMRSQGFDVPKSTPSGKKYLEIEEHFMKLAENSSMTIAEFDLYIWKKYSNKSLGS